MTNKEMTEIFSTFKLAYPNAEIFENLKKLEIQKFGVGKCRYSKIRRLVNVSVRKPEKTLKNLIFKKITHKKQHRGFYTSAEISITKTHTAKEQ